MALGILARAAIDFVKGGFHRVLARRVPKPVDIPRTVAAIVTRDSEILSRDADVIAELVDDGVQAGSQITLGSPENPVDAEVVPVNEYSFDQLPTGDRYTFEMEVDIFDPDGDLLKTIPVTVTGGDETSPGDLESMVDDVIMDSYSNSPDMFEGYDITQVGMVQRQIIYAERAF